MGPDDAVIPCPRCWLLADLFPPAANDALYRSRCARGHENTLAPAVLVHLQEMLGPAFN